MFSYFRRIRDNVLHRRILHWTARLMEPVSYGTQHIRAARALGKLGPEAKLAAPVLSKMLKSFELTSSTFQDVREAVEAALERVGFSPEEVVPELVAAIGSSDKRWRKYAIDTLAIIPWEATDAVRVLMQTVSDQDPEVRQSSVVALGRIGSPQDTEVAISLAAALTDPVPAVRRAAAQSLRYTEVVSPELKEGWLRAMEDQDEEIRSVAAVALGRVQGAEAMNSLLTALADPAPKVRETAAWSLGRFGIEIVPRLISLLGDDDCAIKAGVARALGEIGAAAAAAVPRLLDLPEGVSSDIVGEAVGQIALAELHLGAQTALNAVVAALTSPSPWKQRCAAIAIRDFGPVGCVAVPQLVSMVKSASIPDLRRAAISAIGRLGETAKDAVPVLIEALEDDQLRWGAIFAFQELGPAAQDAVPHLVRLIRQFNREQLKIGRNASDALARIGKAAVPALAEALTEKDEVVRRASLCALYGMRQNALAAMPILIQLMRDPTNTRTVRGFAARALGGLGAEAAPAIPALIEALSSFEKKDEDTWGRFEAELYDMHEHHVAEALAQIGPPAIPALVAALKDKDENRRWGAAHAIRSQGATAHAAIPGLIAALEDSSPRVRQIAACALGEFGAAAKAAIASPDVTLEDTLEDGTSLGEFVAAAKAAIPGLSRATRDSDRHVRRCAAHSLKSIQVDGV